ncbi:MAG: DOMON domain-containing protein [Bacteroidota bacterium]
MFAGKATAQQRAETPLQFKDVEVEGIKFSWRFASGRLFCQLEAPTTGWVAMGFNTRPGLAGTHLVMAAVVDGNVFVDDLYIVGPGDPRRIEALGGALDLQEVDGNETHQSTRISFSIPVAPTDNWRKKLTAGVTYDLLLAYSTHDAFEHHSRIRRHIKVVL